MSAVMFPRNPPPKIRVCGEDGDVASSRKSSVYSVCSQPDGEPAPDGGHSTSLPNSPSPREAPDESARKRSFSDDLSPSLPPLLMAPSHRGSIQSTQSKAKFFKSRASELIIRIPARQLKKIARTEGIGSLQRETQHFVGVTTVNGLLRIYRSKGVYRLCWVLITFLSFLLLGWQVTKLVQLYAAHPTVSHVSFLLPENGLSFPAVTICSHNPIRREYVERLSSKMGGISQRLLEYIMLSFMDVQYLLSVSDREQLELADEEWKELTSNGESRFTVNGFFWNASSSCQQMLKVCSFGGREFDCCQYAKGILTDIGKCYQLDLSETDQPWLKRQVQAGMNNGLQIIADAHTEQQMSSLVLGTGHPFADSFETGFRYYVHERHAMPYLSTEGISVSPGTKVYSAISPTNVGTITESNVESRGHIQYILLPQDHWGNCSESWPPAIDQVIRDTAPDDNMRYSSLKCTTLCRAKYFNDLCGCSPFVHNIEEYYHVCTPFETYTCLNSALNDTIAAKGGMEKLSMDDFYQMIPTCPECKIQCERWVYHTYNSYAQGFSRNSLSWLRHRYADWTPGHVRSNFVSINIFFRDMCYTEYKQVQSISMTEILSDIGGNMGLFLGMSMISLMELVTYLCKITWLFISKKRRDHMLAKKCRDEEREQRLQATLEMAAQQRKFAHTAVSGGGAAAEEQHQQEQGRFAMLRRLASNVRRPSRVQPFDAMAVEEGGGDTNTKSSLELGLPAPSKKRSRSNSVFSLFFNNNRRGSTLSAKSNVSSSSGGRKQHDFVEAVIASRVHGDGSRAARRSATSTPSTSSSGENEEEDVEGEQEKKWGTEAERGERTNKLVELKIDLNAWKQGDHANTVKVLDPKRRRFSTFTPAECASTSTLSSGRRRRDSVNSVLGDGTMGMKRKNTEEIKRAQLVAPRVPERRLIVPSLLIGNLRPAIEAQAQLARRPSLAATAVSFVGDGAEKRQNPGEGEVPRLAQIARKHSAAAKRLTGMIKAQREAALNEEEARERV